MGCGHSRRRGAFAPANLFQKKISHVAPKLQAMAAVRLMGKEHGVKDMQTTSHIARRASTVVRAVHRLSSPAIGAARAGEAGGGEAALACSEMDEVENEGDDDEGAQPSGP